MLLEVLTGFQFDSHKFCGTRCYAEYRNEKTNRPLQQTSFGIVLASRIPRGSEGSTPASLDARLHSTE